MKRRVRLGAALFVVGAIAACTVADPLNPQPLPPSTDFGSGGDASAFHPSADAGALATDPERGSDAAVDDSDGAPPNVPNADAGDASTDAGSDADTGVN